MEVFATGAAVNLASASILPILSIPAGSLNQVVVSNQAAATLSVGESLEIIRTGAGSDPLDATFVQVASKSGVTITLSGLLPELQAGDAPALRRVNATAVISRENGSVVTGIDRIDGREVTVRDLGPDEVLGFAPGHWVELTDDRIELEHRPRQLRQIEAIDTDTLVVTLRTAAAPLAGTADGVDADRHPKLRRWDAARGIVFRADGSAWLHLERGIQVRFSTGQYVSGDYWHFPARAAIVDAASGNIEWPQAGGAPALLPPHGVAHHVCPIAVVDVTQNASGVRSAEVISDCRNLFPPVTQLTTLMYVGGDGQEGRPAGAGLAPLPAPLTARVANGSHPVQGARVEFRITQGTGRLNGSVGPIVRTSDANGIVSATWALDVNAPAQTAEARLLTPAGTAIAHQLLRFHATLDTDTTVESGRCCCVTIGPDGDYPTLEEALQDLLQKGERDICLCLLPGDHVSDRLELNGVEDEKSLNLSIVGCGRATRVQSTSGILMNHGSSLRLTDFDLTLTENATLHTISVDDVTLEGMHIRGMPPKVGVVRIHGASAVRVSDCTLEARAEGEFERFRALFAGVGPLESVWQVAGTGENALRVRSAARDIDGLSATARRALVREIDRRIAGEAARLSANVAARLSHLSATIGAKRDPAVVAAAVNDLKAAVAQQSDIVALEIGAPDDLQEKLTDPANVTPCTITIVDNKIYGNISLYGVAGDGALNVDERALLDARLKNRAVSTGMAGTVHIRDNRLNRLLLSSGMNEALRQLALGQVTSLATLYESFHVTNNVIDGANGQLAALHAVLTSNDYTLAAVPAPAGAVIVQEVYADTAIYTGNHGAITIGAGAQPVIIEQTVRAFASAANLEVNIQ